MTGVREPLIDLATKLILSLTERALTYETVENMLKQTQHSASAIQEPARWQLGEEAQIRSIINLMAHGPSELFTERQRAYMKQVAAEPPQLFPVSENEFHNETRFLIGSNVASLCMAVISNRILPK